MVNYFELGRDKQLNEIVVAGSHDAGITSGGGNVKTQSLDIGEQAKAGVRVFDLRIAAATVAGEKGAPKQAELKAFHANNAFMTNEAKSRNMGGQAVDVTRTKFKLGAGDFGLGLPAMLRDARNFVNSREGGSELPDSQVRQVPELGTHCERVHQRPRQRLAQGSGQREHGEARGPGREGHRAFLAGRDQRGRRAGHRIEQGILGFQNLYSGGGYSDDYAGLQYYGKGGTSVTKPFSKLSQNEKKQRKLVQGAKGMDPDIIGMMYWTTTGISRASRSGTPRCGIRLTS